jgi:hypothetical protein
MTKLILSAQLPGSNNPIAANVLSVQLTTPVVATNAFHDLTYSFSRAGILAGFQANAPCLIRVYNSATARAADTRGYTEEVPAAGIEGLVAEAEIDPAIAANLDVNIIFANDDVPQSESLHVKVFNLDVPAAITLTLRAVRFVDEVNIAGGLTPTQKTMLKLSMAGY